jgi:Asp-tRNA(Asn)/Glu-tRNA(Gln) amidotransferase A subunit family amidase
MLKLENTAMSDIVSALASGRVTATALTNGYLARIEAYDRDGPISTPYANSIPTRSRSRANSTTPNRRSNGRWLAYRYW